MGKKKCKKKIKELEKWLDSKQLSLDLHDMLYKSVHIFPDSIVRGDTDEVKTINAKTIDFWW